jgi:hypothetical protein
MGRTGYPTLLSPGACRYPRVRAAPGLAAAPICRLNQLPTTMTTRVLPSARYMAR